MELAFLEANYPIYYYWNENSFLTQPTNDVGGSKLKERKPLSLAALGGNLIWFRPWPAVLSFCAFPCPAWRPISDTALPQVLSLHYQKFALPLSEIKWCALIKQRLIWRSHFVTKTLLSVNKNGNLYANQQDFRQHENNWVTVPVPKLFVFGHPRLQENQLFPKTLSRSVQTLLVPRDFTACRLLIASPSSLHTKASATFISSTS